MKFEIEAGKCWRKIKPQNGSLKVFAVKFFSENNQKIESEVWNPKWKMVTLRAQVDVCNQPITVVTRNGEKCGKITFFFRKK